MVQFHNVTKIYPNGLAAVRDVNFSINEGEFVFLIGPSGSGKTTLIELLIRDQKPSEGKIYLNDYDITHLNRNRIYKLRRQIGVIFQDYKLIEDKTAYENVAFAMEVAGKKNKEIRETVPYVLDIVGLADRQKSFPVQLSGGEQQRVAIARAIANNPKLLIADEPTGNLDPASAWDIVQVLSKINNWGTTVIMSTHGTDIVNTLNKRVIQMEKGSVLRDDNEGQYEFKSEEENEKVQDIADNAEDSVKKVKTSFTVTLGSDKKESTNNSDEKTGGFFTKIFGKNSEFEEEFTETLEEEMDEIFEEENREEENEKSNDNNIDEETEISNTDSGNEEGKEAAKKKDTKKKKVKVTTGLAGKRNKEEKEAPTFDSKLEKKLKEYADMGVEFLNLPGYILDQLTENGYDTIGKIINDGPEKLIEKIDLNEDEIIMLSKSLEKVVTD